MEGSYLTQILFDGLNKIFYYFGTITTPKNLGMVGLEGIEHWMQYVHISDIQDSKNTANIQGGEKQINTNFVNVH